MLTKINLSFSRKRIFTLLSLGLLLSVSLFLHIRNLDVPNQPIWDETYYVQSAISYNQRVYFMQTHPPLAKMLMALGEELLHFNSQVDFGKIFEEGTVGNVPKNLEFLPYRIFPTLLSWLSIIPLFFIAATILESPLWGILFSSFYLFENAFILNGRAALLDSPQNFFFICALWIFTHMIARSQQKGPSLCQFLWLATFIMLSSLCRTTSLILLPLPLFVVYKLRPSLAQIGKWAVGYSLGLIVPLFCVYYLHIFLGQHVKSDRWDGQKPEVAKLIETKEVRNLKNFPTFMWKNIAFHFKDSANMPARNKFSATENGSHPLGWMLGIRAIEYRSERLEDGKSRHWILMFNPVGLLLALAGLVLSISLTLGNWVFDLPIHDKNNYDKILCYLFLYLSYMAVMMSFNRVLYLHHYLLPHILALVLSMYVFKYIFRSEIFRKDKVLIASTSLMAAAMVICFWFFSPFIYSNLMDKHDLARRNWFEFWQLINPS